MARSPIAATSESENQMHNKDPLDWVSALAAELLASMFAIQRSRGSDICRVMPACPGENLGAKWSTATLELPHEHRS